LYLSVLSSLCGEVHILENIGLTVAIHVVLLPTVPTVTSRGLSTWMSSAVVPGPQVRRLHS